MFKNIYAINQNAMLIILQQKSIPITFKMQNKKGKILKPGDKAFVIGYPKETNDRKTSHAAPDSRGDGHQHVTHGSVWNPSALIEKYALDPLIGILMLDEHYIYAIDSDCEVGQTIYLYNKFAENRTNDWLKILEWLFISVSFQQQPANIFQLNHDLENHPKPQLPHYNIWMISCSTNLWR